MAPEASAPATGAAMGQPRQSAHHQARADKLRPRGLRATRLLRRWTRRLKAPMAGSFLAEVRDSPPAFQAGRTVTVSACLNSPSRCRWFGLSVCFLSVICKKLDGQVEGRDLAAPDAHQTSSQGLGLLRVKRTGHRKYREKLLAKLLPHLGALHSWLQPAL